MVSIHAPRTGRDLIRVMLIATRASFNPRAPHGARRVDLEELESIVEFQSTRPARGATWPLWLSRLQSQVSIHAPRTGRDFEKDDFDYSLLLVSIHAPRTGRDLRAGLSQYNLSVSIHAPRTGRDSRADYNPHQFTRFNPRAPHGARLVLLSYVGTRLQFQSTRPARGATGEDGYYWHTESGFNPRAPHGARPGQ